MLKIRLKRYGRKKKAIYRIIIIDSRKKDATGGHWKKLASITQTTRIKISTSQLLKKRVQEGAQISKTVEYLLKK
uniref:Ribosomal protein S16 n=1 Tax=Neogoniolithon spectabile TaxID=231755 RepID=A0A3G3MGM2_9FLOR|nr:ribosomal protein S16 [Neogoniolithon spectabile]AYR05977.1 ribosomal protein S16 [Neogoniolithon spectabile]